ncbi:MAG: methyltransferase domain-containing protein [Opitutales bacterium]
MSQALCEPTDPAFYEAEYREYWNRPDRWNTDSFEDADTIAATILRTCGPGAVLDVGCGMGSLVKALLKLGLDTHGLDVTERTVAHGNTFSPGRFHLGSALKLPFEDGAFDTLVSTDCLEHIAAEHLPQVLREFRRVARRNVYVRVATTPDRDRRWHLTVQPRAWWEQQFIDAGFLRHPRLLQVRNFCDLGADDWNVSMLWQKTGTQLAASTGNGFLDVVGGEAEAALARLVQAAETLRPNDRALVVGPRAAHAAIVLSELAQVDTVSAYHTPDSIDADGVWDWIFLEVAQADLPLYQNLCTRLVPGGRLVLSLAEAEHSGQTPGSVLESFPDLHGEKAWRIALADTAHQPPLPRRQDRIDLQSKLTSSVQSWVVAIGLKDPFAGSPEAYTQRIYPQLNLTGLNLKAFERDYENPWLVNALVVWGQRADNDALLKSLAERTLADASAAGAADRGAALCVLLYRELENVSADEKAARKRLAEVENYLTTPAQNPHQLRWRISLEFASACLLQALGELAEAENRFFTCSQRDAGAFSPLLGTKTVAAAFKAGWLAACQGNLDTARERWQWGIESAQGLCQGSWFEILGKACDPYPWGLMELQEVLGWAQRCAQALEGSKQFERSPARLAACVEFSLAQREKAQLTTLRELQLGASQAGQRIHELETEVRDQVRQLRQLWQQRILRESAQREVLFWGASVCGTHALDYLEQASGQVSGFIDKDPAKIGTAFQKRPVNAPDVLQALAVKPFVAITSVHAPAIARELTEAGWVEETDFANLFAPVMRWKHI